MLLVWAPSFDLRDDPLRAGLEPVSDMLRAKPRLVQAEAVARRHDIPEREYFCPRTNFNTPEFPSGKFLQTFFRNP